MIVSNAQLTPAQRKQSQKYFYLYNAFNGYSYMCVGETILVLLSIKLNCPDYVTSILGTLIYFSYALLPLGKLTASRVGASTCQAIFWVCRNIAALMVASAILFQNHGMHGVAVMILLTGAFIFYGCRAAGVVMITPLYGHLALPGERSRFIGLNTSLFYISSIVALFFITGVFMVSESLNAIGFIIVVGATFGLIAAVFLKNILETSELRDAARTKLLTGALEALRNVYIRRQILATFVMALATTMIQPISMLTIKKGYGYSDRAALLYSILQFLGCSLFSKLTIPLTEKHGPRAIVLGVFWCYVLLCVFWILCPTTPHFLFLAPLFLLLGGCAANWNNNLTNYFLKTIPVKNQADSSIVISGVAGVLGGLLSSTLSGSTLNWLEKNYTEAPLINRYRLYFLVMCAFLVPCFLLLKRLTPLKDIPPSQLAKNN